MEIDRVRDNNSGLASDYVNLSLVYLDQHDFISALKYSLNALTINKIAKNNIGCAIASLNVANAYFKLGKKREALENVKESLKYSLRSNDKEGQAYAYNYLATFQGDKLSPQYEIDLLKKSLTMASELGLNELIRDDYSRLGNVYLKLNQLDKAIGFFRGATRLSDTLYTTNKRVEAAKLWAKYQIGRTEIEVNALKEAIKFKEKAADRQKFIIFLTIAFAGALAIFVWIYQRLASKAKLTKQESEHMRKELSYLKEQTNPHFLLNALNSLYGISLTKPNLVAEKISELSYLLHYHLSSTKLNIINLDDEIEFIKKYHY